MLRATLSQALQGVEQRVDEFTARPKWILRVLLSIVAVSLFLHFPGYVGAYRGIYDNAFNAVAVKSREPMRDMARLYPPETNYSKRTFRITGPLLARALGADGKLTLIALQTAIGLTFLGLAIVAVVRLTADRTLAALVAAALALTYPGSSAFGDFYFFFDGLAYCLLLAAVTCSHPIAGGTFVFLASWTDERALVAAPLVGLCHLWRSTSGELSVTSLRTPGLWGVLVGGLSYIVLRMFLTARLSHVMPSGASGRVGFALLSEHLPHLPIGAWTGLEGLWAIVLAGWSILLVRRQWLFATALAASLALSIVAALSVLDITRSMAYALPSVFLALAIVHQCGSPRVLRALALLALVLSVAWPYDMGGGGRLSWRAPMPVEVVRVFWLYKSRLESPAAGAQ